MGPDLLPIVVWALEMMKDKYRQLRQDMNLLGTTKAILESPIDTLDQIIRMVTKWDGTQVTSHLKNTMGRKSDMGRNTKTLHIVTDLLEIPTIIRLEGSTCGTKPRNPGRNAI